ncbi:hypothetical protein CDAR_56101 [Caerostris darwini]|uniref:Uncharacterized protein n=1 Tax=Caerostris darwini TaxID=1538125 RepID=A0AAV4RSU4_9ARAC|nr:hypothetical protein CDAR_56101 [Caerostris darwini]
MPRIRKQGIKQVKPHRYENACNKRFSIVLPKTSCLLSRECLVCAPEWFSFHINAHQREIASHRLHLTWWCYCSLVPTLITPDQNSKQSRKSSNLDYT